MYFSFENCSFIFLLREAQITIKKKESAHFLPFRMKDILYRLRI